MGEHGKVPHVSRPPNALSASQPAGLMPCRFSGFPYYGTAGSFGSARSMHLACSFVTFVDLVTQHFAAQAVPVQSSCRNKNLFLNFRVPSGRAKEGARDMSRPSQQQVANGSEISRVWVLGANHVQNFTHAICCRSRLDKYLEKTKPQLRGLGAECSKPAPADFW